VLAPQALRAALLLSLASIGLGCPAPPPHAPECPKGSFCGHVEGVEALRQTREGALSCPKYITWGPDGGAPAAELPALGEGSLDMESTRKRRTAGESDACCYRWYQSCPAGAGADGGADAGGDAAR